MIKSCYGFQSCWQHACRQQHSREAVSAEWLQSGSPHLLPRGGTGWQTKAVNESVFYLLLSWIRKTQETDCHCNLLLKHGNSSSHEAFVHLFPFTERTRKYVTLEIELTEQDVLLVIAKFISIKIHYILFLSQVRNSILLLLEKKKFSRA